MSYTKSKFKDSDQKIKELTAKLKNNHYNLLRSYHKIPKANVEYRQKVLSEMKDVRNQLKSLGFEINHWLK
jgi:hypothetical protein